MHSKQSIRPMEVILLALLTLSLCTPSVNAQGLDWQLTNARGFGSSQNWWVGSLSVFGDHLYAGTWNPLGAEIWRTPDGAEWLPVISSGLGNTHNQGVIAATVFNGNLYAGTYNTVSGAAIWRSSDGVSWEAVQDNGFGDATNGAVLSMTVLDSTLYAGTWNFSQGAQVWRTSNGTDWIQANVSGFGDPHNEQITVLTVFEGALYAGTYNQATGAQIWRTTDGKAWELMASDGLGDTSNVEISSITIHRGILYAGTRSDDSNDVTGSGLWRTHNGLNWIKADSWPAASGLTTMVVHESSLFAGATGEGGAEIWYSGDGVHWIQSNESGFSNMSDRGTSAAVVFKKYLYVATSNPDKGTGVYRTSGHGAEITMTASSNAICAGEKHSYDITLENSGLHPLTRVTLTNVLPGLTEFLSGDSSSGATLDSFAGSVTWDIGTLLPEESISLHITVQLAASVLGDTAITNRITASAQEITPKEAHVRTMLVQCADSTTVPNNTPILAETSEVTKQSTKLQTQGQASPSTEIVSRANSGVSLAKMSDEFPLDLPMIWKSFLSK